MNTNHQRHEVTPPALPVRRRFPFQVLHFTARITIAGQVLVVHTDAPSRALATRQLHRLTKQASIALLEGHR